MTATAQLQDSYEHKQLTIDSADGDKGVVAVGVCPGPGEWLAGALRVVAHSALLWWLHIVGLRDIHGLGVVWVVEGAPVGVAALLIGRGNHDVAPLEGGPAVGLQPVPVGGHAAGEQVVGVDEEALHVSLRGRAGQAGTGRLLCMLADRGRKAHAEACVSKRQAARLRLG